MPVMLLEENCKAKILFPYIVKPIKLGDKKYAILFIITKLN